MASDSEAAPSGGSLAPPEDEMEVSDSGLQEDAGARKRAASDDQEGPAARRHK